MDPIGTLTEPALGTGDLATVAGATAAAMIVAQFAKRLLNLTAPATRAVAMLAGLVVLVVATVLTQDETSVLAVLLAVIVGMQAGLAASALFDNATEGLGHETFPAGTQADPLIGLAIEDEGEPLVFNEAVGDPLDEGNANPDA